MSGPIRMVLGPARSRTQKLIEKEPDRYQAEAWDTAHEALKQVSSTHVSLKFDIDKLQNAVSLLLAKDSEWTNLFQTLTGATLKEEEARYKEAIESDAGHYALIVAGQDKLSELKCMLEELDQVAADLQRTRDLPSRMPTQPSGPGALQPSGSGGQLPPARAAGVPLQAQQPMMKLPKIELPKFSGDLSHWKAFWDMFESSVHANPISRVQKLTYLSSALQGAAASAIAGLAITEDNYDVAVDLLKKRFGKDSLIKNALFSKLHNLRIAGNTTKELRSILDAMDLIFRQLESMGENVEQSGLIEQLRGKLPAEMLIEMQKLKPADQEWTVRLIRTTLSQVVESQEEVLRVTQGHSKATKEDSHVASKPTGAWKESSQQQQQPKTTTGSWGTQFNDQHSQQKSTNQ